MAHRFRALALSAFAACASATTKPRDAAGPGMREDRPAYLAPPPASAACGMPGATTPPAAVAEIGVTSGNSCARLVDGSVWCWGARGVTRIDNDVLGNLACPVATRVPELSPAADLDGSCITRDDGTIRCGELDQWRFDDVHEVAATTPPRDDRLPIIRNDGRPVRLGACDGKPCEELVAPLMESAAVAIIRADRHTCILARDGHVWCERRCTEMGCKELGFVEVPGVDAVTQLVVAPDHACVLRRDGIVVCWGESSCGQAGGAVEAGKACALMRTPVAPTTIVWAK